MGQARRLPASSAIVRILLVLMVAVTTIYPSPGSAFAQEQEYTLQPSWVEVNTDEGHQSYGVFLVPRNHTVVKMYFGLVADARIGISLGQVKNDETGAWFENTIADCGAFTRVEPTSSQVVDNPKTGADIFVSSSDALV